MRGGSIIMKNKKPQFENSYYDYEGMQQAPNYPYTQKEHYDRHHQIRCQLASIGCPIKGDLKYGAQRSNPDGSISLHARYIEFIHPVSKEPISVTAPLPADKLWQSFVNVES